MFKNFAPLFFLFMLFTVQSVGAAEKDSARLSFVPETVEKQEERAKKGNPSEDEEDGTRTTSDWKQTPIFTQIPSLVNKELQAIDFGYPLSIESSLGLTQDFEVEGELDAIIPFSLDGSVGDFKDLEEQESALFFQPGMALWETSWGERRVDINLGLVYRTRPDFLENSVMGLGAFFDVNANHGTARGSLGADVQYQGWYSAVSYYQRLTGWHASDGLYEERALNGITADITTPFVIDKLKLGLIAKRFWGDGGEADDEANQLGGKVLYDISDDLKIEFQGTQQDNGEAKFQGNIKFNLSGGRSGDGVTGNLYKKFEREKKIYVERREKIVVSFALTTTSISENAGITTLTASLSEASPDPITIALSYGGTATGAGVDYSASATHIVIPAGSLSGSINLTGINDINVEGTETITIAVDSISGARSGNAPENVSLLDDDVATPTVTLARSAAAISEASGSATFVATLSAPTNQAVTVALGFAGTTSGGDYSQSASSITIPAGSTTGQVTVTALNDVTLEGDETIIASITSVTNATNGSSPQTITIGDDDGQNNVTLGFALGSIAENGNTTATATLPYALPNNITINLEFSGTATRGTDYTVTGTSITILAGSTSGSITISGLNDSVFEGPETIIVTVGAVTGGVVIAALGNIGEVILASLSGPDSESMTLTDDDDKPNLTIAASLSSVTEAGGTFTITATLDGLASIPITANLNYSGTATRGTDYTGSTSITIPAGQTSASITVTGITDSTVEGNEGITVAVSSITGSNATNASSAQNVTLTDNVVTTDLTLSVSSATMPESGGSATVTATLNQTSSSNVTVNLSYAGTATGTGIDYSGGTSITILAGNLTGTATITAMGDGIYEGNETILVSVGSVTGATDISSAQTVTIADDEALPSVTLSVSPLSISETGVTSLVTATLSGTSTTDVTVNLGFAGTATNISDYTRSATTITILAGNTTGTAGVTGANDSLSEGDETVLVSVTSVSGATNAASTQTITINDDESTPTVTLSVSGSSMAENAGSSTITATLSIATASDVTVNLGFAGTATNTSDYTRSATSITILAGNTTGTASVTGVDDAVYEGGETILVSASSVSGAVNGSTTQTVTITDDESPPTVTLGLSLAGITELGPTATTLTATLSHTSSTDVVVNLGFAGTATNSDDFTAAPTSITVSAGSTTGATTLTAVNDTIYETGTPETIDVSISSVSGATDASATQTVSITDNETIPSVTLSVSSSTLAENGGTSTVTATLSHASVNNATVTLGFAGTATNSDDYTRSATTITVTAGNTTGSATVTGVDDIPFDGGETILVSASGVSGATDGTSTQTITIEDSLPEPTIFLETYIGTEADGITDNVKLKATRASQYDMSADIAVDFAGGGAAEATQISTTGTGSCTIPAGQTESATCLTLSYLNDNIFQSHSAAVAIFSFTNITNVPGGVSNVGRIEITDVNPDPDYCLHGGTAVRQLSETTCICTSSWSGIRCEEPQVVIGPDPEA